MTRPTALLGLFSVAFLGACLDDSITGSRPLSFNLTVSPASALIGDSVDFAYEATGTAIQGVVLAYGDGVADTIYSETSNQVEREGVVRYAYTETGVFEVVGQLFTINGTRADTVGVEITDGSD